MVPIHLKVSHSVFRYLFLLTVCCSLSLQAATETEYDYELDLYYSNVSLYIDIDSEKNITDASDFSEQEIYTQLLSNAFMPNIILLEASLSPMPIAGLYFRKENESLYEKATISDFNLVKSLTAGFDEPYAFSFFLGRMMVFNRAKQGHLGANRAFIGTLLSASGHSIKDNRVYKDSSLVVEFKLKGTRHYDEHDLDWSFRVGSKLHSNHDFTNLLYIGLRRSRVDFDKSIFSLFYNTAYSFYFSVSAETFNLTETEITIEKKWPSTFFYKTVYGLQLGYLYNGDEKYQGTLRSDGTNNNVFIIRPSISF